MKCHVWPIPVFALQSITEPLSQIRKYRRWHISLFPNCIWEIQLCNLANPAEVFAGPARPLPPQSLVSLCLQGLVSTKVGESTNININNNYKYNYQNKIPTLIYFQVNSRWQKASKAAQILKILFLFRGRPGQSKLDSYFHHVVNKRLVSTKNKSAKLPGITILVYGLGHNFGHGLGLGFSHGLSHGHSHGQGHGHGPGLGKGLEVSGIELSV